MNQGLESDPARAGIESCNNAELSLKPWDVAAGRLIVEEAGGSVTAFGGSPCTIYDPELLASNGKIHLAMMEILTPNR